MSILGEKGGRGREGGKERREGGEKELTSAELKSHRQGLGRKM